MNSSYVFKGVDFSYTYKQFVANLAKDMGSQTMNALHAAVGISGEAGEIIDAIKKLWVYNKPLNIVTSENIIEELGDLNFYMQYMQNTYHITDEMIIEANIKKLQKRYKQGYSDKAAIARADKSEHVSDCSSNNVRVPELLGDCGCKKEEQTSIQKSNMQKIMDSLGDTVYFVSPSQMDANNFKYSFGPFQSESSVVKFTEGKRIVTVVKKSDHISWSNWYINAGWVPA